MQEIYKREDQVFTVRREENSAARAQALKMAETAGFSLSPTEIADYIKKRSESPKGQSIGPTDAQILVSVLFGPRRTKLLKESNAQFPEYAEKQEKNKTH